MEGCHGSVDRQAVHSQPGNALHQVRIRFGAVEEGVSECVWRCTKLTDSRYAALGRCQKAVRRVCCFYVYELDSIIGRDRELITTFRYSQNTLLEAAVTSRRMVVLALIADSLAAACSKTRSPVRRSNRQSRG